MQVNRLIGAMVVASSTWHYLGMHVCRDARVVQGGM